mgnify:CR=1 FL=1
MPKAKKNNSIKIDKERCKGCVLCVAVCPLHWLKVSDKVNKKGLRYVEITDPSRCTGCGMCFIMCPDNAIEINAEKKK